MLLYLQAPTSSLSPPAHANGNVSGRTETPLVPARAGGIASSSPGNPFLQAPPAPASSTTSPPATDDPFAKLASGLLNATPPSHPSRKKTDKSDFFQEPAAKPSLLRLSIQHQQPQQQSQQGGDSATAQQAEQQTNVDLFGATPVSIDLIEGLCHLHSICCVCVIWQRRG